MHLTVKLLSTQMRHGQADVRKTNSVSSVNKLRNLLQNSKEELAPKAKSQKQPINQVKVDYLLNTNSTRAAIIFDGQFDHDYNELKKYAFALANLAEVDFNQKKLDYKKHKEMLQAKYVSLNNGKTVLSKELAIQFQSELHEKSFLIWKHQISFIVWDTEQFEGGTYDEERKIWVAATVTKAVYTNDPLDASQLNSLKLGSEAVTSKVTRIVAKTMVLDCTNGKYFYRVLRRGEDLDDFLGDQD